MDELLNSPLGVYIVARSIIEVSGAPPNAPYIEYYLHVGPAATIAFCVHELSLTAPQAGYFDQLSAERLSELMVEGETDLTPYDNEYPQKADALLRSGVALRPFIALLLEAPGTTTWFRDLDRQRQEWVSRLGLPPQASSFHPDLRAFAAGITKPRYTLWTTTSLTERTSSWLQYYAISAEVAPRREPPYPRWRVEVLPTARVYEIHGPQDWNSLCLAYPAPSCVVYPTRQPDALIEPDWQAVSQDWDGVHLSVGGLLTSERVRWGTSGMQTHLFGWDVESTAWLRWVFGSTERLPDGG
ncbi:MAG: hypothetical protein ACLQUY_27230 [Ktedonobacterales bacterium]